MLHEADCDCTDDDGARAFAVFRVLLFVAALSLGIYIPLKYATKLHAIEGLYAFLFPLSSVLVVAGLVFAVKPSLAFRLPLTARALTGAVAAGWIATGLLCVKSLAKATAAAPVSGLFATLHMTTQHIFLSLAVAAIALTPAAVFALFGVARNMAATAAPRTAPSMEPVTTPENV